MAQEEGAQAGNDIEMNWITGERPSAAITDYFGVKGHSRYRIDFLANEIRHPFEEEPKISIWTLLRERPLSVDSFGSLTHC